LDDGASRQPSLGAGAGVLGASHPEGTRSLPYGVCFVSVAKSTRLVQHIYGAIQEYAGFEEPRWFDGPPRKPWPKNHRQATPRKVSTKRPS
jgi:hypothetical protein